MNFKRREPKKHRPTASQPWDWKWSSIMRRSRRKPGGNVVTKPLDAVLVLVEEQAVDECELLGCEPGCPHVPDNYEDYYEE